MQKRVRQVFGWSYPNTHPTPRITLPRVLNPAWGGAVPTPQTTPAFTFAPTCVAAIIRRRRASGTTLLKGRARARHSPAGDGRSPLDFLERCLRRGFGAPRFVRVASGQLVDSKTRNRAHASRPRSGALSTTRRAIGLSRATQSSSTPAVLAAAAGRAARHASDLDQRHVLEAATTPYACQWCWAAFFCSEPEDRVLLSSCLTVLVATTPLPQGFLAIFS